MMRSYERMRSCSCQVFSKTRSSCGASASLHIKRGEGCAAELIPVASVAGYVDAARQFLDSA